MNQTLITLSVKGICHLSPCHREYNHIGSVGCVSGVGMERDGGGGGDQRVLGSVGLVSV